MTTGMTLRITRPGFITPMELFGLVGGWFNELYWTLSYRGEGGGSNELL